MPKRSLKTFAFLGDDSSEPTGYGLGRAGRVTIPLDGDVPPESILRDGSTKATARLRLKRSRN